MKQYIIDTFTDKLFSGNPAAVCIADSFPDDDLMQNIALENNLAETAFIVKNDNAYNIRWFTPMGEIDFCGHATLAAAFVLLNYYEKDLEKITFESVKGSYDVQRNGELIEIDFPAYDLKRLEVTERMIEALGAIPMAAFKDKDIIFVLRNEGEVCHLNPDMAALGSLDCTCIAITAKGIEYDCVSRVFMPKYGIDEDAVTGSVHSMIAPYWSRRLDKTSITAFQASDRTGVLYCTVGEDDRVKIAGKAVLFAVSDIEV